jgi:hypothetical protein
MHAIENERYPNLNPPLEAEKNLRVCLRLIQHTATDARRRIAV